MIYSGSALRTVPLSLEPAARLISESAAIGSVANCRVQMRPHHETLQRPDGHTLSLRKVANRGSHVWWQGRAGRII